jgi:seryl-tRNA synthetase
MITLETSRVTQASTTPMATPTVEEINAKAAESREKPMPVDASQKAHVDLSEAGRGAAGTTAAPEEASTDELSEKIKEISKRIAKLREELQEQMAELQAVMRDRALSEEQRKVKAQGIQAKIGSTTAALMTANAQLLALVAESKAEASKA